MSIINEIERIKSNIANAYTALKNQNATIPSVENSEGLSSAIASIQTGGGSPITKGLVINATDDDGYATDVSIVGMTKLPDYYLYQAGYMAGTNICFLAKAGGNFHLPNDLVEIGAYCFYNFTNLNFERLPETLTDIGTHAFCQCNSLTLKSIPRGVTSLLPNTFQYCSGLTELTCEGDMQIFGRQVFGSSSKFAKLVLPNQTRIPTLNSNTLIGTKIASGTGYIYVPDELVENFKSATTWANYADVIKGVSEL